VRGGKGGGENNLTTKQKIRGKRKGRGFSLSPILTAEIREKRNGQSSQKKRLMGGTLFDVGGLPAGPGPRMDMPNKGEKRGQLKGIKMPRRHFL